ncbi:MAG: polymer-forming cytoskeletal protein [Aggregatilineales bacterium]
MRKGLIAVIVVLLLSQAQFVSARELLSDTDCVLAADEAIEGSLFAACRSLVIEGRIEGDLIAAAVMAQINGIVTGNVFMLAGQLDVRGTIGRDLHFAGPLLHLHPEAVFSDERGSLYAFSLSTHLEGAAVPGIVLGGGYQLLIHGPVGGNIDYWGSALVIDSTVGGEVNASVGDPSSTGVAQLRTLLRPFQFDVTLADPGLLVTQQSMVMGVLIYSAPAPGTILATLPNEAVFIQTNTQTIIAPPEGTSFVEGLRLYLGQTIREYITIALIGIFTLLVAPRSMQAPVNVVAFRSPPSLGIGLITFIISFPLLLIIIVFSTLAILLLSLLNVQDLTLVAVVVLTMLSVGSASLFYFFAIFISRVVVSLAIGRLILRRRRAEPVKRRDMMISLFVGVGLLSLVVSLPLVGWIFNAIAAFLGLGALMLLLQEQVRESRRAAPPHELPSDPHEARRLPPPLVVDEPRLPGTDNLPEGFNWWK